MSCQKGVMLMLLYTEIQTVTFGRMNTNKPKNLVSCKSIILLIRPSGMMPSENLKMPKKVNRQRKEEF
jgi:hypothetical protein